MESISHRPCRTTMLGVTHDLLNVETIMMHRQNGLIIQTDPERFGTSTFIPLSWGGWRNYFP